MNLKTYKKKRNLKLSEEPAAEKENAHDNSLFVIQKHDATRLHYDFRLAIDGVLKSWAIPKGPSTDPSEKRLAIQTEDHPLDYAKFEGVIPAGEYGAGTVMIWDKGHFKNLKKNKSLKKGIEEGHLEFWLQGKKLQGGYAFNYFRNENNKRLWLLVKMKDDQADARRNPANTQITSAESGRSMKAIEKQEKNN